MVVDSPPGITSPSRPSSSAALRTSTPSRLTSSRARRCSRNAPWRASTPTLPATRLEQPVLAEGADLDAHHRLAEAGRDLSQHGRVVEVGGRLDDRHRAL